MATRIVPDTRFDFVSEVIDCIRDIHTEFVERERTNTERKLWQTMHQRDINLGGGWD